MNFFNYMPDIVFIQDATTGEYLDSIGGADHSQFAVRNKNSLIGKKTSDIFPEPVASRILLAFSQAVETGMAIKIAYPYMHNSKLGEQWYRASIQKTPDDENVVVAVSNISREKLLLDAIQKNSPVDPFFDGLGLVFSEAFIDDLPSTKSIQCRVKFGFTQSLALNSVLSTDELKSSETILCKMVGGVHKESGAFISRSVEDILVNHCFYFNSPFSKQETAYHFEEVSSLFKSKVVTAKSLNTPIHLGIYYEVQ